jgi:hypothetical protein
MNKIRTILLRTQKDTGEVIKEDDQDIDIENDKRVATEQATVQSTVQASGEVGGEVLEEIRRVILVLNSEMKRSEIQNVLELKSDDYFRVNYIIPSLEGESIEMIYPESPNTHNNYIG